MGEYLQDLVPAALLLFDLEHKSKVSKHGVENLAWGKLTAHEAARFFLFFPVVAASLFATTLFFSSVGSGLFRVR